MIALGFHSVLLDIVETTTGSQWAAQVSESIELRLTYGLVISALLFLGVVSVLKYLVPWQRVRALFTRLHAQILLQKQLAKKMFGLSKLLFLSPPCIYEIRNFEYTIPLVIVMAYPDKVDFAILRALSKTLVHLMYP